MRPAILLPLASVVLASVATAQQPPPTATRQWGVDVGMITAVVPAYPGADQQQIRVLPLIQAQYGRFFAGPSMAGLGGAVGAHVIRTAPLSWTVEVGSSRHRFDRDADALAGMDRQSSGAVLGTQLAYRPGPVELAASVAAGRRGNEGIAGSLAVGSGRAIGRWMLKARTSAEFGDRDNVAYDFGVSSEEAARRSAMLAEGDIRLRPGDDRVFAPRGGLKELRAEAMVGRPLSQRWTSMLFAGVGRLQGDAAESPLTRRRTTVTSGVGLAYRLGGTGGMGR